MHTIDRRTLLGSTIALGTTAVTSAWTLTGAQAATQGGAQTAPGRKTPLNPDNPADQGLIFRKVAYTLAPDVSWWWLRGTRYAIIDNDMIPLWQTHIGSIFTVVDGADGGFDVTMISTSFYTDLVTGAFLESYANPVNGKTVTIGYFPAKPSTTHYRADGTLIPPPSMTAAGFPSHSVVGPTWSDGEQLWIQGDYMARNAVDSPTTRHVRVNDMSTYSASLRAVVDPAVTSLPAGQTFSDVITWPEWLGMGDQPGTYYSRMFGRKVASFDAMPETWRRLMSEHHPAIVRDPSAALHG